MAYAGARYLGPRYWGEYFGGATEAVPVVPIAFRDMDSLESIRDLILATDAFDGVYFIDPPERRGQSASDLKVAIVEWGDWREEDDRDDPLTYEVQVYVTFYVTVCFRDDDPEVRDREVDRLQNVVRNAINGQVIAPAECFPSMTRLNRGEWLPSFAPERRIRMTGEFSYSIFGADGGPTGHDEGD